MRYPSKEVKQSATHQNLKTDDPLKDKSIFINRLKFLIEDKKVEEMSAFIPCAGLQCMYTINFQSRKTLNVMGVEQMLGYPEYEFNFNTITKAIHPDDKATVSEVKKAVMGYLKQSGSISGVALNIVYRVRKKNGDYIKVLHQASISCNSSGTVYYHHILANISFMKTGSCVEWAFKAPDVDHVKFRSPASQSYQKFFSARELEVLDLIYKGFTSLAIANKLCLSKHTVDTHRRKMLQKTGCTNSIGLLEFYRLNMLT